MTGKDRSLRSNIDATDKVNDIRLSLNSKEGSRIVWILVEGEDDCKIYPKFFEKEKTRVEFVGGGKTQLMAALNTLMQETKQVIGIQDADFLHLEGIYPTNANLFYTDCHDIEMTMLSHNDVRTNLSIEYKLDKQNDIWNNVLKEASHIAYIRWYNEKNNCEILFSGLKYGGILTEIVNGKIQLNTSALLDELNTRSKDRKEELTIESITNFIDDNITNDMLNLCNGHDVIALFSLIIGKSVSFKEFGRHLRLSFTIRHFSQTKLYAAILDWQTKYSYTILKATA